MLPSSYQQQSIKALFTLQHSSIPRGNKGNDVASLCFFSKVSSSSNTPGDDDAFHDCGTRALQQCGNCNDESESEGSIGIDSDSDSDDEIPHFKCRAALSSKFRNNHHHLSVMDQATSLSFSHTLLASSHANGAAHIWDLMKRRVVSTLGDDENGCIVDKHYKSKFATLGPGLAIGRMEGNKKIFHQTRDSNGTISIYNAADGDYRLVQRLQSFSQTFCQATSSMCNGDARSDAEAPYHNAPIKDECNSRSNGGGDLILSPSQHEAFAQLWDVRIGNGGGSRSNGNTKSVGVIHGAKMDSMDVSKWRDEGMLMSLNLCNWEGNTFIGCGMESGKVFFHDLRMMGDASSSSRYKVSNDVIDTSVCSVSLGKDPVLCLDMCRSNDEHTGDQMQSPSIHGYHAADSREQSKQSIVAVAGMAADAMEQLAIPEEQRGTVAVIKATTLQDGEHIRMNARVRAQVGTCQLSNEIGREGKPGIGVCKFRPDGKVFAVGGWDKRVRVYSRTSAKMLSVLKGPNDVSVTALDWAAGDGDGSDLTNAGVLAAGSGDGKISVWRAFPV